MKMKLFTVSIMVGAGLVACGTSKSDKSSEPVTANAITANQNVPRYVYVLTGKDGSQQTVQASAVLSQSDLVAQAGANTVSAIVTDQSSLSGSTQSFWSGTNSNSNCHRVYSGSTTTTASASNSRSSSGRSNWNNNDCHPVYSYANANVWYSPIIAPVAAPSAVIVSTTTVQPYVQPYAQPYSFGSTSPYAYANMYQASALNTYGWGSPAAGIDMGYGQATSSSLYGAGNGYAMNSGVDCARQSAFTQYGSAMNNSNCVRSDYSYIW